MMIRIVTAIIGIPIILLITYTGGLIYTIAIAVAASIGMWEYKQLFLKNKQGYHYIFPLGVFLICMAFFKENIFYYSIGILLIISLLYFLLTCFSRRFYCFLGIAYIYGLFGFLVLVRNLESSGLFLAFLLLFLVWANDTGAFMFGKFLGKRKLAPHISPHKTWEGACGGLGLAIIVSIIIAGFGFIDLYPGILLGFLTAIFAQLGDLAASKFKRLAGVKDFGVILPGHGGVMDRFDSLIFAAPIMYIFIKVFL